MAVREFTGVTCHRPLFGLFDTDTRVPKVLSPRMHDWILLLAAYSHHIQYRPGQDNSNADALSRLPPLVDEDKPDPPCDVLVLDDTEYAPWQAADIAKLFQNDRVMYKARHC